MLKERILVIGVSLVFCFLGSVEVNVGQKKSSRRTVTKVVYVWEPTPGSAFYEYTRALAKVSRIEVSQIAGRGPFEESVVFGKEKVRIFASKSLVGLEAEKFAAIWRRQKQGAANACFAPAFLLRFHTDDKLAFETILCFHCHNLMLSKDGEFWGFDAAGQEGQELLIKELLPPMG